MKDLVLSLSAIVLAAMYISCEKTPPQPSEPQGPSVAKADSVAVTAVSKDDQPEPDALPCNRKMTGPFWDVHHYEPIPGKLVGFWPGTGLPSWSEMRTKWGFTGILVSPDPTQYPAAISAGFSTSNMMIPVGPYDWMDVIDGYAAGKYYSGEPTEHNCQRQWV